MTKREFQYALKRGLGRCIPTVQKEPERFRDLVLWACSRNLSYDTQCEGTRAWFVYQLICCYDDPEPFVRAAKQLLFEAHAGDWAISYAAELLSYFMDDGNQNATDAIKEKYRQVYAKLMESNENTDPMEILNACEDLERICIVLGSDARGYLRAARDLGRLFPGKEYLQWRFSWFYDHGLQEYGDELQQTQNPDVRYFLEVNERIEEEHKKAYEARKNDPEWQQRVQNIRNRKWKLNPIPELADLILDYTPEKEPELYKRVKAMRVGYEYGLWHSAGLSVLNMFDEEIGIEHPPISLLYLIYETTLCSSCREYALDDLRERNGITPEMLEEMQYDSNDEIREMAAEMMQ